MVKASLIYRRMHLGEVKLDSIKYYYYLLSLSTGFGSQQGPSNQYLTPQNQYSGSQQYSAPGSQYGTPQYSSASYTQSNGFGAQSRYQSQSATSRQYLTPKSSSFQNGAQQSFDEETGYHY